MGESRRYSICGGSLSANAYIAITKLGVIVSLWFPCIQYYFLGRVSYKHFTIRCGGLGSKSLYNGVYGREDFVSMWAPLALNHSHCHILLGQAGAHLCGLVKG